MAKLVLGIASSHAPQLEMPPETWRTHGESSRQRPNHWFRGQVYSYEELFELRAHEHLEKECTAEKFATRFASCQRAIGHLGATLKEAAPDVCIIIGDDQHEAFQDDNLPAFAIYHGASVDDGPWDGEHRIRLSDPKIANRPAEAITHPTNDALGRHLIEALTEREFDVARSNKVSLRGKEGAIGHAFHYVYRRLMDNRVTPSVPVMVNTYFPPNAPTAKRCYRLGEALRQAIEAWDSDELVAVIASGGLSHTVIEENFDREILAGLKDNDASELTGHADLRFRGGTSEIKNWIALGGVMAGTELQMQLVDYVPCYRTEAGNGCAMGFAKWV